MALERAMRPMGAKAATESNKKEEMRGKEGRDEDIRI